MLKCKNVPTALNFNQDHTNFFIEKLVAFTLENKISMVKSQFKKKVNDEFLFKASNTNANTSFLLMTNNQKVILKSKVVN